MKQEFSEGKTQETYNGIEIIGSRDFVEKTKHALSLVWNCPSFMEIKGYVLRIEESTRSGMTAQKSRPTYQVGEKTSNSHPVWYASTIAHDGFHSKLYHENGGLKGAAKKEAWTGDTAERECSTYQMRVISEMDVSDHVKNYYIEALTELINKNTGYHEIPLSKRDW